MIKVYEYNTTYEKLWNDFVKNSKNGIFLFNRNFMEYHSDRFEDNSLLFFDNDELVAAKVYERVDGLKPGDHVDEFFLNASLLRILDILIYIDNERQDLEEDETYEVEDEEEIIIATCNELIISLFKKADERKETIKRVIARAATEVHKEV